MTDSAKHPYHLVDPSPWPALGALAALCLTAGLVLFMQVLLTVSYTHLRAHETREARGLRRGVG